MELFAQYGLLGLVLAGIGIGAYRLGKPISDAAVKLLTEAVTVLQQIPPALLVIADTAKVLEQFHDESKDECQPYSAILCRRALLILGKMLHEQRPDVRENLLDELRQTLNKQ